MHGLIFLSLRRFVESELNDSMWEEILVRSGITRSAYQVNGTYPDWEVSAILNGIREISSTDNVVNRFGRFLAGELVDLNSANISASWDVLDLIMHVEESMHQVVRIQNPGASPPVLRVQRLGINSLQVVYASPRKLCQLAVGIIHGLAERYGETLDVTEESCMLSGAPYCTININRLQNSHTPESRAEREGTDETCVLSTSSMRTINLRPDREKTDAERNSQQYGGNLKRDSQFSFLPPPRSDGACVDGEIATIGKYSLRRLIGKGAMGQVFEALDTRLQRLVAIKVLSPHLLGEPIARDRFLNEARSMASISHSNVISIFSVDECDGIPYIVMPLLNGDSLETLLRCHVRMSVRRAVTLCVAVAQGLGAAHKRGVIHRDIKPDNIWVPALTEDSLLMDFGLSLRLSDEQRMTRSGIVIGTPNYMSPEQAEGGTVDFPTDVYSLGAVMYHMVVGRPPFEEPSLSTTLIAIASRCPEPAHVALSAVPVELGSFISELMSKEPSERPCLEEAVHRMEALVALH